MSVIRATPDDVEQILYLQGRYLADRVPRDARNQGFLTTAFTREMVLETIADPGTFVAHADAELAGFLIMGRLDWYRRFALVDHLLERLAAGPTPQFKPTDLQSAVFYGPACIDASYRGQGLLARLLGCARHALVERYRLGLTFVAEDNRRSYAAHVDKLCMTQVDHFRFHGATYHTLAFAIGETPVTRG